MLTKVTPIENTEYYQENKRVVLGDYSCPRCLDTHRIVYGSDTEGGRESMPCECKCKKGKKRRR
jgi:hypothetical protein